MSQGFLLSIAWTGGGRMLSIFTIWFFFVKSILFALQGLAQITWLLLVHSNYCCEHERRVGTTMCETSW
ncbi:hypothetical protein B0F90DRAFT_1735507 [Multifurca ochricompacta]|uniref:Uncharacterized protein n=1 Tax=Multifurca ochricompacta TaxID=376703 RepID=A0AAD4M3F8_9AGAM|nr:hypothetical protein B0F90DRAFT_1735507 [Multifurca ochricompacta]